MLCDVCQRAAAGYCSGCGSYYCFDHGGKLCFRCSGAFIAAEHAEPLQETSIYTTEKQSRFSGRGYLQCDEKPKIPTVHIYDDGPPECYECCGIARKICHHCHALFCPEHAGYNGLCAKCSRSSWMGVIILAVATASLAVLLLLNHLFSR